jgi:hypothetical protein
MVADPVRLAEILSPGNEAETWRNVWAYTTIPTVGKSWRCGARGSRLNCRAGRKLAEGTRNPSGRRRLTLTSIGLGVAPNAFYQTSSLRA